MDSMQRKLARLSIKEMHGHVVSMQNFAKSQWDTLEEQYNILNSMRESPNSNELAGVIGELTNNLLVNGQHIFSKLNLEFQHYKLGEPSSWRVVSEMFSRITDNDLLRFPTRRTRTFIP